MMCRVTAPLTAQFRREPASRSPFRLPPVGPSALYRRLRIARHRALRWFNDPIASVERERRERDLAPSVWGYDFRPWASLSFAKSQGTRRASIRRLV